MALQTSSVHRRLDSQLKIVGLEIHDLLFVLLFASIMNLIFGQTAIGTLMVIYVPLIMALTLFFIKRNKADKYLIHLIKYHLAPGFLSAGEVGKFSKLKRIKIYEL